MITGSIPHRVSLFVLSTEALQLGAFGSRGKTMRCVRQYPLIGFLAAIALLSGCVHDQSSVNSARQGRPTTTASRTTPPADKASNQSASFIPASLVGMDEPQLVAMLGPPTSEDIQAPGKTWRYRKPHCTVDLTLYPDVQTRIYRALAYEVTSNDNSPDGKRLCLAELQSGNSSR